MRHEAPCPNDFPDTTSCVLWCVVGKKYLFPAFALHTICIIYIAAPALSKIAEPYRTAASPRAHIEMRARKMQLS